MKELFQTYLLNSISLSVVGVLVLALLPLISRRVSAKCRFTLWLIILFALIIPIHPQIQMAMPKAIQPLVAADAKNLFIAASETSLPSATERIGSLWQIAAILWAAGAFCFLCWYAFHHFRFRSAVKRWSEEISPDRKKEFQIIKAEIGIKRQIAIYSCACIRTPMMVGFLKPVILFPKIDLSTDEFSFILKHELVHYKRKDLYSKMLILLALIIHWFNPLVHIMARSAMELCEISCDEEVLQGADSKIRAHYGETIIGVVRKGKFYQTALSTNFYSGSKGIKNRIYAIMDMKRKRFSFLALAIVSVMAFCGISAFAIKNKPQLNTMEQTISANSPQKTDGSSASSDSSATIEKDSKSANQSGGTSIQNRIVNSADEGPQLVSGEQTHSNTLNAASEKTNSILATH